MSALRSLLCCAGSSEPSQPGPVDSDQPHHRRSHSRDDRDDRQLHSRDVSTPPQLPEKMSVASSTPPTPDRHHQQHHRDRDQKAEPPSFPSFHHDYKEQELLTSDWAQAVFAAAAADEEEEKEKREMIKARDEQERAMVEAGREKVGARAEGEEKAAPQTPTMSVDANRDSGSRFESYSAFSGWATTARKSEEAVPAPQLSDPTVAEPAVEVIVEDRPATSSIAPPVELQPTLQEPLAPLEFEPIKLEPFTFESRVSSPEPVVVDMSPEIIEAESTKAESVSEPIIVEPEQSRESVTDVVKQFPAPISTPPISRSSSRATLIPAPESQPTTRAPSPYSMQLAEEFNPTRDPRRASTLSTISNIIAPAAAAAAIMRHSSSYTPHSRPSTPSKRFSQLSTMTASRPASPAKRFSGQSNATRPFSSLSIASAVSSRPETPEEPVRLVIAPSDHPLLQEYLQPLKTIVLPVLDALLANTSILSHYALWESAMSLKREVRAFIASGADEFLCVDEHGEVVDIESEPISRIVRAFVERGDNVKQECERRGVINNAPKTVSRVRSFWMERA